MIRNKISFCFGILCLIGLVMGIIIQEDALIIGIVLVATVVNFISAFDD